MKTEQTLSNLFRQLRPSLRPPKLEPRQLRHTSHFVAVPRSQRPLIRPLQQRYQIPSVQNRYNSTSAPETDLSITPPTSEPQSADDEVPRYELTFTCKPCLARSTHRVTKQGYHHGSILITCPSCKNRHVFADHLKIFGEKAFSMEDLMREKGIQFKRGSLGGDMEFWDDGTQTERAEV